MTMDAVTKARRKNYARSTELMRELDQFTQVTKSATVMHPRFYNKPYKCTLGQHDLFTDNMMGVPFLTCRKCGWTTLKSAHEGTDTMQERHENPKAKPKTFLTRDIIDLFYPERRKWK